MAIDRTNYELWFTDWSDNILTPEQIAELALFLRQNPDLDAEFKSLGHPLSLQPPDSKFNNKNKLFKTAEDITSEKFDLLCAAYVENDLAPAMKAWLDELILNDPGLRRSLELMRMTRLSPPDISYGKKEELMRTNLRKTAWLPSAVLAIAASVAALMMLYFLRPAEQYTFIGKSAVLIAPDTFSIEHGKPVIAIQPSRLTRPEKKVQVQVKESIVYADTFPGKKMFTRKETGTVVNRVEVSSGISSSLLVAENNLNVLAAFNPAYRPAVETDPDDDRSRIGKFIARTFREKILKSETGADTPIKGYELAEAGVTGINKLFGWDMQLVTHNNSEGLPTSVNFRSRLLKFNAPVNKNEQAE